MVYCTRYQITRPYMDKDDHYKEADDVWRSIREAQQQALEDRDSARSYYINEIYHDYDRA